MSEALSQMLDTITRSSYGADHTYLKDDGIRDAVSTLTGKKTVSQSDLDSLAYILGRYGQA